MGQVLLRPRPRARVLGHRRARASCDAWERLVASFDRAGARPATTPTDVTARRIQNWIYAWQRFASAPASTGLRPGSSTRCSTASRDAGRARARAPDAPERNHRTLELYALLVAALALPGASIRDACWHSRSSELHANLADGLPARRRPPRELDALPPDRAALVRRRARERAAASASRCRAGYDERLAPRLRLRAALHRPDGPIPALSDADSGDYGELLALGGRLLERPDLRWVASAAARARRRRCAA